jgi:RNA 3'-phosphate cyclase
LKSEDSLKIDGSMGEGGGSIVRLSAAFSILFNRPIKIYNIRANRSQPGLRTQHLLGLKVLSQLTNSTLSECRVGTKIVSLIPNKEIKRKIIVNVDTAASIGLLIQPLQIACLGFSELKSKGIEILLRGGGTFGKWAPSLNYLKHVTYKVFENLGFKIDIQIFKHGFYPKGGAEVNCVLYPPTNKLTPINLTELGNLEVIKGEIILTNHLRKNSVGERIKKTVEQQLRKKLRLETNIGYIYVNAISPGVGLSLWAESDSGAIISTGTILGEKDITSEKLGLIAVEEIYKYIQNKIPVDNYLSDQLIPLMAFSNTPSKIKVLEVTSHTKTNLELINLFIKRNYTIIKKQNYFIIEFE